MEVVAKASQPAPVRLSSPSSALKLLSTWDEGWRGEVTIKAAAPLGMEGKDPGSCQNDSQNPQRNGKEIGLTVSSV